MYAHSLCRIAHFHAHHHTRPHVRPHTRHHSLSGKAFVSASPNSEIVTFAPQLPYGELSAGDFLMIGDERQEILTVYPYDATENSAIARARNRGNVHTYDTLTCLARKTISRPAKTPTALSVPCPHLTRLCSLASHDTPPSPKHDALSHTRLYEGDLGLTMFTDPKRVRSIVSTS